MDNFDLPDKTVPMEGRIVSHWKFSAHPLRLRVVAPQTPVPDGAFGWLPTVLHCAYIAQTRDFRAT